MTMTKADALKMIDKHKNALIDPVEMLRWTALRVIVLSITDEEWEALGDKAREIMSV